MSNLLFAATAGLCGLQTVLMTLDELYFHRRRTLSLVEAAGHGIDTALFFAAILIPAVLGPSDTALTAYVVAAVLSSLVVTKDEWIHAQACAPGEHWVHSLLFILHGPLLIGIGALWLTQPDVLLLKGLPLLVGGWGVFQLSFWILHHAAQRRSAAEVTHQQRLLRRPRRPLVSR